MKILTQDRMSLLALVSSQRLTVSQSAFINQITASTLNVSSIGGGNLISERNITSTVQGLGSIGYVSSLSLFSTVVGLGSASYVSSSSLVSTTADLQRQFQTAGFLSSPNLFSTVAGLGTASYISSPQLLSTSAGIASLLGSGLVTANLTSTVTGIATSFSISSLTTSTMSKVTVFEGNPQIMLSGTASAFTGGGTLIKISRNGGSTWGNITSGDFTSAAIGFAYNGRMWVAVGAGGATIKYSFDAINWSNATGGFPSQGQAVAWNGRMWVAVGYGNTTQSMQYSFDGINWQGGVNCFTSVGHSIAWGGNLWVAVGQDTTQAFNQKYSGDGINWSNRNSGPTISFNTAYQNSMVTFGKNLWVVVGSAGNTTDCIQVSSDGSNWSGAQSGGFANCNANSVAYNGTVFVASGADTNQVRWSYNALNWSNGTGNTFYTFYSILYTGSYFYAIGQVSMQQTLRSFDGIFWDFGGSPSNSLGFGLGFSSNSVLTYDQSNLQITGNNLYNVIGSWTSTSMIVPQYGTLNINDALFINRPFTRLGVNCNVPRFTVDVNGSLNTNTLLINTTNFTTILTSTVTGINNSVGGGSFPSTVSTSYGRTFGTSNFTVSTINFLNVAQSNPNVYVAVGQDTLAQNNTIKYSFDGSNWINSSGVGFTDRGFGVAWGGNLWVAVGNDTTANNRIKYSGNGINWSNSTGASFGFRGNGVAHNGRLWVALGQDNFLDNIKYSGNGITWSNGTNSFNSQGFGAGWNGQIWVAVGEDSTQNNMIKYSLNGINWSNSSGSGFTIRGRSVAWNGRLWVAVGQDATVNNTIKYSGNGINWSNSAGPGFTSGGYGVAWNGCIFVSVGFDSTANNTIKYSVDGLNWSNSAGPGFTSGGFGITWSDGLWVAVGSDTNSNNQTKYSRDGINWSNSVSGAFWNFPISVAYSYNQTFSYNQSNLSILPQNIPLFLNSTNTIFAQPSSMILNNTVIIDGQFDRVGINCNVPQNTLDVAGTATLSTLNFVNVQPSLSNLWIATGDDTTQNNRIQYSLNGINWIASTSNGFTGRVNGVAWGGNVWVAVGQDPSNTSNTIYYSFNGLTWFIGSGNFDAQGIGVAYNGRMWVAVGADNNASLNNRVKYSFNGINWSNSTGDTFSGSVHGAGWNGYMWVAVGFNSSVNNIKYSYNGINWSNAAGSFFSTRGYSVAWNGKLWVAVGIGNTATESIKYSYDGINWSNANTPGINIGYSVVWNGTYFLATGNDSFNATQISFDGINWVRSSVINGNALAWNGTLWQMVTSFTNAQSIRYSSDGFNWINSSGTGFSSQGLGVAFSSNLTPAYQQQNLSILPQNIPLFLTSTNTILAQPSSLVINNTLEVDMRWSRVGINCNVPRTTLDVEGQTFTSSIQTNIVSTLRVQASTIAVLNVPTLIFWADATKATTNNSFTVVSSMSNVFLGSNLIQSNGSADAGIILPYSGSYMFEVSGWRCGTGAGITGVLVTRAGTSVYGRVRTVSYADCSIFTGQFFWNLFQAGDKASFYKNENNTSLNPNGATATNQNLPFSTASDDSQGPIKVWYYGGSGNI